MLERLLEHEIEEDDDVALEQREQLEVAIAEIRGQPLPDPWET